MSVHAYYLRTQSSESNHDHHGLKVPTLRVAHGIQGRKILRATDIIKSTASHNPGRCKRSSMRFHIWSHSTRLALSPGKLRMRASPIVYRTNFLVLLCRAEKIWRRKKSQQSFTSREGTVTDRAHRSFVFLYRWKMTQEHSRCRTYLRTSPLDGQSDRVTPTTLHFLIKHIFA